MFQAELEDLFFGFAGFFGGFAKKLLGFLRQRQRQGVPSIFSNGSIHTTNVTETVTLSRKI